MFLNTIAIWYCTICSFPIGVFPLPSLRALIKRRNSKQNLTWVLLLLCSCISGFQVSCNCKFIITSSSTVLVISPQVLWFTQELICLESCNREWALYPTWGVPQASPSALPPRILTAVPLDSHTDGQLKREEEVCTACLKIPAGVTWQSYFMLNWCPQCHQRGQGNKQKSQRSEKGLSKFLLFFHLSLK